ncbi:MAG: LytTR family DNA-binding domain-containing protein [Gemmatimonadales bacterium]|nr:LytTR family DNA-binding domain-containing protein [Gemmatimonadales bacterium]
MTNDGLPHLRAAVVDDEPLARARLIRLLAAEPGVEVVLQAAGVEEAIAALSAATPDLLFVDVQMPERDGFSLVEALTAGAASARRPYVVFVTAHALHAARAFDVEAGDFLVKPVEPARLARAVARARAARQRAAAPASAADWAESLQRQLAELLQPAAARAYLRHFAVTLGRRTLIVPAAQVDWIRADGNYARLHAGRQQYLVRTTMQGLEEQLDPAEFVRIHRSAFVRLDRVREVIMLAPGEYRAVLADGTQLDVMRSYRARLPG